MPEFKVVSEYTPSASPRKSAAFAGAPGFHSNGQAEPAHSKVLACAKTLMRRTCGGGPQARCWSPPHHNTWSWEIAYAKI